MDFRQKKYIIERNTRIKRPFIFKRDFFKLTLFKIINIILLIGIIFGVYFFIFSNFYKINNIEVAGNQIISTDDILDITNNYLSKKSFLIFKHNNIFICNKNELKRRINEYILLNQLKIDKILPNTLRITLTEKDAALKWISGDQNYLVDKKGIIIKRFYKLNIPKIYQLGEFQNEAPNKLEENFLKIINLANEDVNLGQKVFNEEDVEFIFKLTERLAELDYLKLKDISVPNNMPKYISLNTEADYILQFNLSQTIESQISRLELLIREKIGKENMNRLEYIDLRLGESVYYKFK
ncbi:FtsQ-type POTRA domain-containing protein [Candidatus Falkowbacteria bacterium]|nr:FtsQ-type POTRA domain-containing protein [Candidatus Falkowbacteria bacterium]